MTNAPLCTAIARRALPSAPVPVRSRARLPIPFCGHGPALPAPNLSPFRCRTSRAGLSPLPPNSRGSSWSRQFSPHARRLRRSDSARGGVTGPAGLLDSRLVGRRVEEDCNRVTTRSKGSFSSGNARRFPGLESSCGCGQEPSKPPTGLQPRARSVTARASASAAAGGGGSSALPSRVQNWWATIWANILALFAGLAARLESIRIGSLDLLMIMRIVILAASALGAYVASKRFWGKFREQASNKSEGGQGGNGGPMQILARGATTMQSSMGPWSLSDMALGLTGMAKLTEKKPPSLPGKEVKDLERDGDFLVRAQHWRVVSEAVYAPDSGSFSLFSTLPESAIVHSEWSPNPDTFRPAYCVYIDAPYGAVVLGVRGTSHIIDMLLNSGTSVEPVGDEGGVGHGGFVHASGMLYDEVLPHIEKGFRDHGGNQKQMKLVVVGHSLGAAVGTLTALKLRKKYPDLECWGFCPPACLSLDLAKECKSFTTSFVARFDLVPRFSLHTVERLRTRLQEFDFDEVERVARDDEDWQSVKAGMDTFRKLQKVRGDAEEKLSTVEGPQGVKKVLQSAREALESDKGQQIKAAAANLGKKANEFLEGTNEVRDQKKEGEGGDDDDEENVEPPPPLYPPGRILVLGSEPPGCGKLPEQRSDVNSQRSYGSYPTFDEARKITWRMLEAEQENFEEIVVSPWLISDHMLGNLCEALAYFQRQVHPIVKK